MIYYIYGNSYRNLADRWQQDVARYIKESDSVFTPSTTLVQNNEMGQWLSQYFAGASQEGVASGMDFMFPANFMWRLYRRLHPGLPDPLPSTKAVLQWKLFNILSDARTRTQFAEASDYLDGGEADETEKEKELRTWQLAVQIAGVFDQYQLYRPQLIRDWQNKRNGPGPEWQARLWRECTAGDTHPNRVELQDEVMDLLAGAPDQLSLPSELFVFGISVMPPVFIQTLVRMGQTIDVHFYGYHASAAFEHFSPEDTPENMSARLHPMEYSLGQQALTHVQLLRQFARAEGGQIGLQSVNGDVQGERSILGGLQTQIGEASTQWEEPGSNEDISEYDFPSVTLQSCHSPMREVEVLYDHLLKLFNDPEGSVHPGDVMVLAPDLSRYAPYINAVFGGSRLHDPESGDEAEGTGEALPPIPYQMTQQALRQRYPEVEAFLQLLQLPQGRLKVSDVMGLLEIPAVYEAFGFREHDLPQLHHWIREVAVRWGVDADHRQKLGFLPADVHTWKAALDRLMTGYAVPMEEQKVLVGGRIAPYSGVEGSGHTRLLGNLDHFITSLIDWYHRGSLQRTVPEWCHELTALTGRFLAENSDNFWPIQQIRQQVNALEEQSREWGDDKRQAGCSIDVIESHFSDALDESFNFGGYLTGRVTIGSLATVRSMPFKVICLLGMDEDQFPRRDVRVGFDVMARQPEQGDRDYRLEDRNLFLELLMAAGQKLYISYLGRSVRDEKERPPSVVVNELRDYLEETVPEGRLANWHIPQKLHAHDPDYFNKERPEYFTFNRHYYNLLTRLADKQKGDGQPGDEQDTWADGLASGPDERLYDVSVDQFVRFFRNAARYFLENRLGVYLREEDFTFEDREPFTINPLDRFLMNSELLNEMIEKQEMTGERLKQKEQWMSAVGVLPYGSPGHNDFMENIKYVRQFRDYVNECIDPQAAEPLEVDLRVEGMRISGTLTSLTRNGYLYARMAKEKSRDHLLGWVWHLLYQYALKQNGLQPGPTHLFLKNANDNGGNVVTWKMLEPVSREEIGECMSYMIRLYREGIRRPLKLMPETLMTYSEAIGKEQAGGEAAHEKAKGQAKKKWEASYGSFGQNENIDPYWKYFFGDRDMDEICDQAFRQRAEDLGDMIYGRYLNSEPQTGAERQS